jgi:hypothetical protein
MGRGVLQRIKHAVTSGEYVIDVRAVAEAVLASGVLVAAQPADGLAVATRDDESRAL